MFSSRGLFREVACPGGLDCTLPNCFFRHEESPVPTAIETKHIYDPTSLPSVSPPPAKRRKLDSATVVPDPRNGTAKPLPDRDSDKSVSKLVSLPVQKAQQSQTIAPSPPRLGTKPSHDPDNAHDGLSQISLVHKQPVLVREQQLASTTRTVSPPAKSRENQDSSVTKKPYRKPTKTKGLAPRSVDHPPAQFKDRHAFLKKLHKAIEEANTRYRKDFPKRPELFLNKEEIETQAMDDEERIARSYDKLELYRQNLGNRMASYTPKKMTPKQWEDLIQSTWNTDPEAAKTAAEATSPASSRPKTGLDSPAKEITVLKLLRTGLHQHAQHGYIIKPPSDNALAEARKVKDSSFGNQETCDRCGSRFQVFPGRSNPDHPGQLTTNGPCVYHWGRSTRLNGHKYPCCGSPSASTGCTTSPHHVFKTTDPARLALVLPFKETPKPTKPSSAPQNPIVFDCEMAYTTLGLELVRLTALSWPTHQTRLDILVRPIGEILDMNTRFSGVTPTMLSTAADYGTVPLPKYDLQPPEPLQRVPSPSAARDFLFDLLDPTTPLIGHAIENDLNACRIIHPFVIDTVLLYPHPRGLPVRYKLKDLARMYLDRYIQTGGEEGHDSKEDSVATGDLVLRAVREKWISLRKDGWRWEGEKLMPGKSGKAKDAEVDIAAF